MPRTSPRFTREQRRRLNDLLKGIGKTDAILRGISDEVAQIFLTIDGDPTADDIAFMRKRLRTEIDNAYGATQAASKTSPMYRAMDDAIVDAVLGDYQDVLDETREIVESVSEDAWKRVDTVLTYGPDTDGLAGIKRMMDLPEVAKRRELRTSFFDPDRRWVARQKGDDSKVYTLSERTWRAGKQTRTEIDRILNDYTSGKYAGRDLYAELDQYLNPDKSPYRYRKDGAMVRRRGVPVRTKNANSAISRLLRTEMQHANFVTTRETAKITPGVVAMAYRLSNHQRVADQCDPLARGSSAGFPTGVYTFDEFPIIPQHSNCRCAAVKWVEDTKDRADAIIRKYLGASAADDYASAA